MNEFQMQLVSKAQACRTFKLSKNSLEQLINEGAIKIHIVGKREKISMLEIVNYLKFNSRKRIVASKNSGEENPVINFPELVKQSIKGKKYHTPTSEFINKLRKEVIDGIFI